MLVKEMCRRTAIAALLMFSASPVRMFAEHTLASREFFFIGGKYEGPPETVVMAGQMYVEVLRPQLITRKYPLIFFHGNRNTAVYWTGTPDGRAGWADYFLSQGYIVYLVDQPARGRSAYHASINGPVNIEPAYNYEWRVTATEAFAKWPQAKNHTQWPGHGDKKGRRGDPNFDAFYASIVPALVSDVETQKLVRDAGVALLDRIGPAILVTHSQAGPFGWLLADARPKLVKAIVAVEPNGPPFQNEITNKNRARQWGITDAPLTYYPSIDAASDLKTVREQDADGPDLVTCWKQDDPPRQLLNLRGIAILIVTTEASYHAAYDHCTAKYLTQAGVNNEFMRLEDHAIHGNGHFPMIERNNIEIATLLNRWITGHVK